MCVPSPGPRCSYHAHKEYLVALQKFEAATTADTKLVAGNILKAKSEVFYSTPRGQNFLRREADANEGLKRTEFLNLLRQAEETRASQLHAFQQMVERKDSSFKDKTLQEGKKFSRYVSATALTVLFLKERNANLEVKIVDKQTVLVNNKIKVLVLPSKHQNVWGETTLNGEKYETESKKMQTVLNSSILLINLDEQKTVTAYDWFEKQIISAGYNMVASVNVHTQDVVIMPVEKIRDTYSLSLKLAKRLGGTTYSLGEVEAIEKLLPNTLFSEGKVVELANRKKTVITGVPPQPKHDCILNAEYFLSWRQNVEGEGYFEVRKRHISKAYNIVVKLKTKKTLFASGIDLEMAKELKALA